MITRQNNHTHFRATRRLPFTHLVAIPAVTFFLSCLALSPPSQAEEIPRLTLIRAVEFALQNNSDLKTTMQQVKSAETTVLEKQSDYYPTLEDSVTGTHLYNDAASKGTSVNSGTNSLSTSVNLFNGFADRAAVDGANYALLSEKQTLSRVQQSTVYQTITTFINAVTNQELITVAKENLQENRRQLTRIEAFYKSGKRPISDYYQQQAETSQAELTLLTNERDLESSKLSVLQLIGLTASDHVQIVAPEIPERTTIPADKPNQDILANALANALATRADLQAQELRVKAADEEITRTHAGLLPKISLSAAFNLNSVSQEADGLGSQVNDREGTIGVSIAIPLFDRWKTQHAETQAKINRNKEQIAQEQLSRQVGIEVKNAVQNLRTAAKQIEVAESQVRYARQALAASEERYNVGVATLVDLSATRKLAVEAQYGRIKAMYDLLLQQVGIAYAQGDAAAMLAIFASN